MRAWALARFACAVFSWFSAVVLSMRARTCPAVTVGPAVTSTSVKTPVPWKFSVRSSAAIAFPVAETVCVTEPVRTGVSVSVAAAEPSAPSDVMPKATRPSRAHREHRVQHQGLALHGLVPSRHEALAAVRQERGADVVGGLERVAAAVDGHRRLIGLALGDRHAVIGHARPVGVERSRVDPTRATARAGATEDGALGQEVAAGLACGVELAAVDRGRRRFGRTAALLEASSRRDLDSLLLHAVDELLHVRGDGAGVRRARQDSTPQRWSRHHHRLRGGRSKRRRTAPTHQLACARSRRAESQPGLGIT